jgi:hypothetical protein
MYRPTPTRLALRVLTVVFWISATIFVVSLAVSSFIGNVGELSSWTTGMSLLVVTLSSGALAWWEFRNNPDADAERGEWTNKMLFYALVFCFTFFVAFLYLPGLYFGP